MQGVTHSFVMDSWAGLHDVPDRPSAKVAPVGCQLATMPLKIKTVTIPKTCSARAEVVTQSGTSVHNLWAELHETGGTFWYFGSQSAGALSQAK